MMSHFAKSLNQAATAKERFNSTSLIINRPKDIQDYIDNQQEQIDLQSEFNEKKRTQLKAEMEIRNFAKKDGSTNSEQIERDVQLARERAGVSFDQQKAEENRKKAQQQSEQQDKRSASSAETVAQKLAILKGESELAAGSTQQLTREQQLLRAEQSLGAGATDKKKQEAREYKADAIDAADAAKGVSEALKNIPEEAENNSYSESMKNLKAILYGNTK